MALVDFFGRDDLGKGGALDAAGFSLSVMLRAVFERLADDGAGVAPLAELATLAGCGRYRLIRRFRAATGLTQHAWQLDRRINRALHSPRERGELADVAHRLGFSDQSHFQRVFKAYVGSTPGQSGGDPQFVPWRAMRGRTGCPLWRCQQWAV